MSQLLCLHGFTGAPESWDGVAGALPPDIELRRPAVLGHGADAPGVDSFEDEVDRLAALVSGGGRSVRLAGYSQGGRLALGLLVRHSALFASATLIGASPGLESAHERRARRAADERLARSLDDEGMERFLDHWEALPLFASQSRLPAARLAAQREQRLRHRAEELARALRVLGLGSMPNYWPELARLDVPLRLMVGERDEKFRRIARRMAARLPRAEVEVVPAAGHNLLLEAPEAVARALMAPISEWT